MIIVSVGSYDRLGKEKYFDCTYFLTHLWNYFRNPSQICRYKVVHRVDDEYVVILNMLSNNPQQFMEYFDALTAKRKKLLET